jgi:hypothetical protein
MARESVGGLVHAAAAAVQLLRKLNKLLNKSNGINGTATFKAKLFDSGVQGLPEALLGYGKACLAAQLSLFPP